jgi:hypothetical protein
LRYTIKTTARKIPVHNQRTVVYGNVLVLKRGVVDAATKTWKITEGMLKEMYDKRKKNTGWADVKAKYDLSWGCKKQRL